MGAHGEVDEGHTRGSPRRVGCKIPQAICGGERKAKANESVGANKKEKEKREAEDIIEEEEKKSRPVEKDASAKGAEKAKDPTGQEERPAS